MKHAIVADVHGSYKQLEEGLAWIGIWKEGNEWKWSGEYFVISVGDLNDYYHTNGEFSSVRCIKNMMEIERLGYGTTVQSNHQYKLLRMLKGNKVKVKHGLENTKLETDNLSDKEKEEIKEWLENRPNYYKFNVESKNYVVSHAYYQDLILKYSVNSQRQLCIYGPNNEGVRQDWWNKEDLDKHHTVIVGHYHTEWENEYSIGIDGDAGVKNGLNILLVEDNVKLKVPFRE